MFKLKLKSFKAGSFKPQQTNQTSKKIDIDLDFTVEIESIINKIELIHNLRDIILPEKNQTNIFITSNFRTLANIFTKLNEVESIRVVLATINMQSVDLLNKYENVQVIARSNKGDNEYLCKEEIAKIKGECFPANNHVKSVLVKTKLDYYVFECSGNMKNSAKNEILTIDNNKNLYNEYNEIFEQIKHKY